MVLQTLLGTTSRDRSQSSRPKSPASPSSSDTCVATPDANSSFIHDEAQLQRLPPECPDLRELNNGLAALAAVFPDVQIEVFREMLAHFDGESRLAVVADALLKNRVNWVKGRWRVVGDKSDNAQKGDTERHEGANRQGHAVPPREAFRSAEYKEAVRALAWSEFRGLPRSTIFAVLAECNYCYLDARKTLVSLSSKSWRFTFSAFFSRRKPVADGDADNHPLVTWKSTGQGAIIPTVRTTGNPELDREMYEELIRPLKDRARADQEEKDHGLAVIMNTEEAESQGAMHECCCCFTESTFEEFTQCNAEGHMICFRCVRHSVTEAVFGQGWHSSIDAEAGTLKCLSVEGGGDCCGRVPADHLHRAMLGEKKGAEILHKLDRRLAEHSLLASQLPLIRCPFCDYAEIDDIYLPRHETSLRVKADSIFNFFFLLICIGTVPFLLPVMLVSSIVALVLSSQQTFGDQVAREWSFALNRHRRRRRGAKFTCLNPRCCRASCLSCSKSWTDIHVCNESSLVALRTQVEQAMSMAIKRVCPRCGTSFVKNSGCNKLVCPCGYKMCYVCRKDIGGVNGEGEGYRHFCDHFRPDGDPTPCTQCDRCNLWESEDTEAVLREAKEEAERKWQEAEGKELRESERSFIETGFAGSSERIRRNVSSPDEPRFGFSRLPTLAETFDVVVENIFV